VPAVLILVLIFIQVSTIIARSDNYYISRVIGICASVLIGVLVNSSRKKFAPHFRIGLEDSVNWSKSSQLKRD
jgi:hypothetical protein